MRLARQNIHYLSVCPSYFVNNVREDDILVVRLAADLLPLGVLAQPHVVPQERMANTEMLVAHYKRGKTTQSQINTKIHSYNVTAADCFEILKLNTTLQFRVKGLV